MQGASHGQLQYLRSKVENASPIGRVVILCEASLRFIAQSKDALRRGDKFLFTEKNIRAQNIIRELRNSLNLDHDEKIGAGFYNLYNYCLKQLMQSVRIKKIEPMDTVVPIMEKLHQAWKEADAKGVVLDTQANGGKSLNRTFTATQTAYATMSEGLNVSI